MAVQDFEIKPHARWRASWRRGAYACCLRPSRQALNIVNKRAGIRLKPDVYKSMGKIGLQNESVPQGAVLLYTGVFDLDGDQRDADNPSKSHHNEGAVSCLTANLTNTP